jgi:hypothetical protein
MNNDNFHRIASVSKAITKQAIFELVKRDNLNLNDLVFGQILTEFNVCGRLASTTVSHLINH